MIKFLVLVLLVISASGRPSDPDIPEGPTLDDLNEDRRYWQNPSYYYADGVGRDTPSAEEESHNIYELPPAPTLEELNQQSVPKSDIVPDTETTGDDSAPFIDQLSPEKQEKMITDTYEVKDKPDIDTKQSDTNNPDDTTYYSEPQSSGHNDGLVTNVHYVTYDVEPNNKNPALVPEETAQIPEEAGQIPEEMPTDETVGTNSNDSFYQPKLTDLENTEETISKIPEDIPTAPQLEDLPMTEEAGDIKSDTGDLPESPELEPVIVSNNPEVPDEKIVDDIPQEPAVDNIWHAQDYVTYDVEPKYDNPAQVPEGTAQVPEDASQIPEEIPTDETFEQNSNESVYQGRSDDFSKTPFEIPPAPTLDSNTNDEELVVNLHLKDGALVYNEAPVEITDISKSPYYEDLKAVLSKPEEVNENLQSFIEKDLSELTAIRDLSSILQASDGYVDQNGDELKSDTPLGTLLQMYIKLYTWLSKHEILSKIYNYILQQNPDYESIVELESPDTTKQPINEQDQILLREFKEKFGKLDEEKINLINRYFAVLKEQLNSIIISLTNYGKEVGTAERESTTTTPEHEDDYDVTADYETTTHVHEDENDKVLSLLINLRSDLKSLADTILRRVESVSENDITTTEPINVSDLDIMSEYDATTMSGVDVTTATEYTAGSAEDKRDEFEDMREHIANIENRLTDLENKLSVLFIKHPELFEETVNLKGKSMEPSDESVSATETIEQDATALYDGSVVQASTAGDIETDNEDVTETSVDKELPRANGDANSESMTELNKQASEFSGTTISFNGEVSKTELFDTTQEALTHGHSDFVTDSSYTVHYTINDATMDVIEKSTVAAA